jgi:DNA-binding HxlR family transcriptional regulator
MYRCIGVASPATFTSTLRALEAAGLLRRSQPPVKGRPGVMYGLTAKGYALYQSLLNMEYWFRSETIPDVESHLP